MDNPTSLENLHGIVLPPEVGMFPLAPGWYVVLVLIALVIGQTVYKKAAQWKHNKYRREGLKELERLYIQVQQGEHELLRQLPVLLKSVALAAYPRQEVAQLYGDSWRVFINSTMDGEPMDNNLGQLLGELSWGPPKKLEYVQRNEVDELFAFTRYWLKHHQEK